MLLKLPEMSSLFLMLFILPLLRPLFEAFLFMRYFWRLQLCLSLFSSFLPSNMSLLCPYRVPALGMLNMSKNWKYILDHLLIAKKGKLQCSEILWRGSTRREKLMIKRFMMFITLESVYLLLRRNTCICACTLMFAHLQAHILASTCVLWCL